MLRRLAFGVFGALLALATYASPAGADAPGPTNFQSEILRITPEVEGVELRLLGGDSFVQLIVDRGVEVVVTGYGGEPYLRVLSDGVVEENHRSPAKYLNEERYADTELPVQADRLADPEWIQVDDDGTWAWHDHRTHLMTRGTPAAAAEGDQINEGVIPLLVNGTDVKVFVATFWLPSPSPLGSIVVGLVAVCTGLWAVRRGTTSLGLILAAVLTAALLVGGIQNWTLPAETGPSILNWVLPGLGLLGLVGTARGASARTIGWLGALLLGAVNLVIWGYVRRLGLTSAVLPGSGPEAADRAVTTVALVFGALAAISTTRLLLNPLAPTEQD